METISEFKGLNGNIVAFKEAVGDVEKVTFLGTPGVCTPFAALFSQRDFGFLFPEISQLFHLPRFDEPDLFC